MAVVDGICITDNIHPMWLAIVELCINEFRDFNCGLRLRFTMFQSCMCFIDENNVAWWFSDL